MRANDVLPYHKWNWGGDRIIHDTVIPASRQVPSSRKRWYPIDIREFLSTEENAVVRETIRRMENQLPAEVAARIRSDEPGSFDLRADTVVRLVSTLRYVPVSRRIDTWMFPDETLANRGGDCEDLAFLLAALLEASGISPYCIRVALGRIVYRRWGQIPASVDHSWVMYLNEGGAWEVLEPLAIIGGRGRKATRGTVAAKPLHTLEYVPYFVFNRQHLWVVRTSDARADQPVHEYLTSRDFRWKGFKPLFAAGVHSGIYDEALAGMPDSDLASVKRSSLVADVNVLAYDPRDHFDFAYVDESWARVKQRLATGDLGKFAYAIHAVADFYAHTFYSDFAKRTSAGKLVLYDPDAPKFDRPPRYDFTPYLPLPGCKDENSAAVHWDGKLISGQWWRWYTTFPTELKSRPDFAERRCLPDHDKVAVDDASPKSDQCHYTQVEYPVQFRLRRQAAVDHIKKIYADWKS